MPKTGKPGAAPSLKTVLSLLERHACPVPFHQIRTIFLGNIAAPGMTSSPMSMLADLWDGELPTFDNIEDANELLNVLINGVWNALTRHQKRSDPFRLSRPAIQPTREGLAELSLIRMQEFEGFIEGLFSGGEPADMPEKASIALDRLEDLEAMVTAVHEMAIDPDKPADQAALSVTLKHLHEITRLAEEEINRIVLECTRARREMLSQAPADRQGYH